jgi:hypothetical protein
MDPDSLAIRRGLALGAPETHFCGDNIPMADGYIFDEDEGYTSSPIRETLIPSSMPGSPTTSVLGPPSQIQGRQVIHTFPKWLRLMVDTFIVRGTNGPIQWLLDLRTYGKKVFFNTPSEGHIGWKGEDELLYKQIHFTMGDFRGIVHSLVDRVRTQLQHQLLLAEATQVPSVHLQDLYDDPTQRTAN